MSDGLIEPPEVHLPRGVSPALYDGPTWFLILPDGRELRLAEHYEGDFTVERCDVGKEIDDTGPLGPFAAAVERVLKTVLTAWARATSW